MAQIVDACSDTLDDPKPPWEARKVAYLEKVPTKSASARLVSAADKLHNAQAILRDFRADGEALWDRFNGGKAGTLWYYRALVSGFTAAGGNNALTEELDRVVTELESLANTAS